MERLIVKNFGPLKDVDIELNKINLFIGENGSGKSVLAKLLNILKNLSLESNIDEKDFKTKLESFGIPYNTNQTIINYYIDEQLFISVNQNKFELYEYDGDSKTNLKGFDALNQLLYVTKKLNALENVKDEVINPLKESLNEVLQKFNLENINNWDNDQLKVLESMIHEQMVKEKSHYIPAERNLISLFSKSIFNFISANLPTPKYLIEFGSQFELARGKISSVEFLGYKYIHEDGLDKVYFNKNDNLELHQSSSATQSILPLLLVVQYFKSMLEEKKNFHVIIEEPELNLFPKAQLDILKQIIDGFPKHSSLNIMTHSPYILSTLNILMMAHKVGNLNEEVKKEVEALVPESQWMNRDDFSAYYLEDGEARNIKGRTGLISENEIDEVSDDIQFEFEELLTIYREHKNDK